MSNKTRTWSVILLLTAISVGMRLTINNVAPILSILTKELSLSNVEAGLTTTLPLICFGLFAFVTPIISQRFGLESALFLSLIFCALGCLIRGIPNFYFFFLGILVTSLGVGIGNVMIPVAFRKYFGSRAFMLMGWFSVGLNLGAGLGAATVAPLIKAGFKWTIALNFWLIFFLLLALVWGYWMYRVRNGYRFPIGEGTDPSAEKEETISIPNTSYSQQLWTCLKDLKPRLIAFHMAIQSGMFFSIMTWGPTVWQSNGMDISNAGWLLSIYSLACIPGALAGPLLFLVPRFKVGYFVFALAHTIFCLGGLGVFALPFAVQLLALVGAGLGSGALLSVSLSLITQQRAAEVPLISALANGFGFLIAAIGPVALGALAAPVGWPILMLVLSVIPLILVPVTWYFTPQSDSSPVEAV